MPSVLAILADGFEEIETVSPIDLLRRAGAQVSLASLHPGLLVTGRCGMQLLCEAPLEAFLAKDFDCLLLPGGPHVRHLRADPRVKALADDYAKAGRWIGAICAAPTVLHDAGLLKGRRYTAHFSVAAELREILAGCRVVTDGRIITSRGAGTSIDFGLALVEHLFSPQKAREIAAAICS